MTPGAQYVIEQLGQALEQAHSVIGQQQQRIAELEAALDEAARSTTGDSQ